VTPIPNLKSQTLNPAGREILPLSLLNDFLYCSRRAALKVVEGWRSANEHTARGDIAHEHADTPGYEIAKGVTLLRALPVFSELLGLSGKCDIVEQHPDGSIQPVEFKIGRRREFENDDVQLCAQAVCLEEMFQRRIERGAVFHAASKRRRVVEFNAELRLRTQAAVTDLRGMITKESVPPAPYIEGRCEECSLFEICLPRLTQTAAASATVAAAHRLFQT
jgi:CRISPR-associated exonuclease Cas4